MLLKKFFIFLVCVSTFITSEAQVVTSFPTDHDKFLKELELFMTAGKMDNNIQTMQEMNKMLKDGKLNAVWLDGVIATSNLMAARMMAPYPHFYNYLNAAMNAVKSGRTDAQIEEWNKLLGQIIPNQKKGDNSDFLKFVEFSNSFFLQNALNSTPAKTWRVETSDYKFSYEDNKPSVIFPTTTLTGASKGDSVTIKQTAGIYYPLEYKWVGKSGRVDWGRVGLDPGKVYCTFNEYTVNTNTYTYSVDTVAFYYTDYFKHALIGKMVDKINSGGDTINMTYPRFESYELSITIKDLAPNVAYTGGFSLHGSKVLGYGTTDNKAMLTFYARDGKTKILSARVQSLSIKKGVELGAEKAEVSIYFGADSIYHPQLNLVYKIPRREMRLLRGETGLGMAKFTDSYHNDEFQTDAIFWNLDSAVLNLKILSGVGKKPGVYESVNYFDKELLRKTQGLASYEPLSILKKMYEKTGSRDINTTEFARTLDPHMTENEVKSLLYDLVANGFILYNEDLGVITVRDKALNYVLAKAKKIDYDIITIKSAPQSGNDYIDLKNSNIDLKGVFEVPISDTAYVYFRPKDNSISLQKDRNMEFDGLMYAGRMDMTGEKFKFQYLPFTVELTKVDTMRINIPDSNKVDKDGMPMLKPMKSKVEGIKGLLEIDAPINKSGRTRLPQFPRLYSRDKSYIYYDDSSVAKGAYGRKNFFFELEPFRLDSLNNFSPDIISWKGKLVSGGIFPDIHDSVHLQSDESLGFKSQTPEDGYDLYKGKGKYYGKFELNYNGLQGDARITHSTAGFTTHDVRLYPDSLLGTTDSFFIEKTFDGVKTPKVTGDSDAVFWTPGNDTMEISMKTKTKSFAMYDDTFTTFKGKLMLTDKGLGGNGTLDWDLATLTSKDVRFRTMDLNADTAALNIKTTGDRVSFKTPNVNAKVDFKTRIGDFKSNQQNIPTDFTYNQYTTAINEFKWFMDDKILDFKAPQDGPGEYFTSTKPDQKGLKFLGKRATYNLVSSVLLVEQVPEIRVADASIVPDSGVVVIEGEAKMHILQNAVIVADTLHKAHRFDSATVEIYSKEEMSATGNYHYNTGGIQEVINFGNIGTKKQTVGERKNKQHDVYQLQAKANIDEAKNFVLYPNVNFNGEMSIISVDTLAKFKGYAKIGLKNPNAATSDFFINQGVDPRVLALKYDTAIKSAKGNMLHAGIHLNPVPDAPLMYTTLLAPKKSYNDITLFNTSGIVTQLPKGEYVFGDENKIRQNAMTGNILTYDDKRGTVKAEGLFNLGLNFGIIGTVAAGTADVKLDTGKYKFNLTLGLDAQMNDKMQERFEFFMSGDDADQPDINYESEKLKKAITELCDVQDDKKMLDDFNKTSAFTKRPKNFDYNLVFTDVNFVFDPDDVSLRSVGKIGVGMIGKKVINKKVEGYVEMQYKGGVDVFTIFLQTGTKGWFYFEYRPGILSALSSYDDFNKALVAIAPDKRKIKGDKNRFYLYAPASALNESDFVDYMKDKAAGISRARPAPHMMQEEVPLTGDTSMLGLPGDTGAPQAPKQGLQQQDINQIEQMKATGGNILSGPPPDRQKAGQLKQDSLMPKPDARQQKEQQEIEEIQKMQGEGANILSGPPPDRLKQPAGDTMQMKQAPANSDTSQLKINIVPPSVPVQEPMKKDTTPANPSPVKSDTIQQKQDVVPPPPPVQEPVKKDATPVTPSPVKSDTIQQKQEVVPPPLSVQEPVKKDTTSINPSPVELDTVQPKQDAMPPSPADQKPVKKEATPVNPAPTKLDTIQPKSDVMSPTPPVQEPVKKDTTSINPSPLKLDTIQPNQNTKPAIDTVPNAQPH